MGSEEQRHVLEFQDRDPYGSNGIIVIGERMYGDMFGSEIQMAWDRNPMRSGIWIYTNIKAAGEAQRVKGGKLIHYLNLSNAVLERVTAESDGLTANMTQIRELLRKDRHSVFRVTIRFIRDKLTGFLLNSPAAAKHQLLRDISGHFTRVDSFTFYTKDKNVEEHFRVTHELISVQQTNDPLARLYPTEYREAKTIQKGVTLPADELPKWKLSSDRTFIDLDHYLTTMMQGITLENNRTKAALADISSVVLQMRIMAEPGAKNRYFGFIQMDVESKLPHDTRVTITFTASAEPGEDPVEWHGVVTEPFTHGALNETTISFNRAWDKRVSEFGPIPFGDELVLVPEDIKLPDLRRTLHHAQTVPVKIRIINSEKPYDRMVVGLRSIQTRYNSADTIEKNETRSLVKQLLANNLDDLSTYDAYAGICQGEQTAEVERFINEVVKNGLNEKQSEAIDMLRNIHGRIGFVHGPPGTGKTEVLIRMALPLLKFSRINPDATPEERQDGRDRIPNTILITASDNNRVTELAERCQKLFDILIPEAKVQVVRLHSLETETEALRYHESVQRKRPENARPPPIDSDFDPSTLEEDHLRVAKFAHKLAKNTYDRKYKGIKDKRLQSMERSSSTKVLEKMGVISGELHDPDRYRELISLYQQLQDDDEMTPENLKGLNREARSAHQDVIYEARVIVVTNSQCGEAAVYRYLHPDLLLKDEVSKEMEPESLIPISLTNCPTIMTGDHHQVLPFVASLHTNLFGRQLETPIIKRMDAAGYEMLMLVRQYRMHPVPCKLVSSLFYRDRLITDDTAIRPEADKMKAFNKAHFNIDSNLVFINIKSSADKMTATQSRFNNAHVTYAMNHLVLMVQFGINPKDIWFLPAYDAQFEQYRTAYYELMAAYPDVAGVHIEKIDSMQGRQGSHIISDEPNTNRIGFLRSPNRVCVAWSRCMNSLTNISNHNAFIADKAALFLKRGQEYAERKQWVHTIEGKVQSILP